MGLRPKYSPHLLVTDLVDADIDFTTQAVTPSKNILLNFSFVPPLSPNKKYSQEGPFRHLTQRGISVPPHFLCCFNRQPKPNFLNYQRFPYPPSAGSI